jgi:hypothetical protein
MASRCCAEDSTLLEGNWYERDEGPTSDERVSGRKIGALLE